MRFNPLFRADMMLSRLRYQALYRCAPLVATFQLVVTVPKLHVRLLP